MTLRHIKIFISVCDTGSTTAAARELFIAQPAVSFAIAELEHFYGQKLFDRVSNRLRITEAGKRFLQYARQIVKLFDEMEDEIKNWDMGGTLRIGSDVTLGSFFLPPYVRIFCTKYPDIDLSVTVEQEPRIEQMLLNSRLDFALLSGPLHNPIFKSELLFKEPLVFICPREHSWAGSTICPKQLDQCDFILQEKDSPEHRIINDLFKQHQLQFHMSWQSMSCHAMLKAVENGLGIAFVPRRAAEDAIQNGQISRFDVEGVDYGREIYIVSCQNKLLTEPARDFIEMCGREEG